MNIGQVVMYRDANTRAHFGRVAHIGRRWVTLSHGPGTPTTKVALDSVVPWPPPRDTESATRSVRRGKP
jgi:hypothetical protein